MSNDPSASPPNAQEMAPGAPAPGVPASKLTECAKCHQWIDPTTALYSDQGELVCNRCNASDTVVKGYRRAAEGVAHSALGMGLLSLVCNPFFIFSIIAVVSGISALITVNKREYREQLGDRAKWLMVEAVVGIVAGAVRPGLTLFVAAILSAH